MEYNIDVEWTGSYPNLCRGRWNIEINGKKLSGLGTDHMNTYGNFGAWHFEDWSEVWEYYNDGLSFEEWKCNLPNNLEISIKLAGFKITDELLETLYRAISTADWRSLSCGGCI